MNADEILVMAEGRVVERGTHAALLQAEGHYARMWSLQLQEREGTETLSAGALRGEDGAILAGTS